MSDTILQAKRVTRITEGSEESVLKFEVANAGILEHCVPEGGSYVVTAAKTCNEEEVEAIKALCNRRGYTFEEATCEGVASSESKPVELSAASAGGKESN